MGESIKNVDFKPPANPWILFAEWYALAGRSEPCDPNAMVLATVGAEGEASARVVLLKGYDASGLTFFTNRQSLKGIQLARHPKAAVCFYWKSLKRQVRAEGPVAAVDDAESDAYFGSRPRGSQIGAWASDQSKILSDRATLERRIEQIEKKYEGQPVPRPPHWGGYRLAPLLIEFWQERDFRLHDRIVYHRASEKDKWVQERLYP